VNAVIVKANALLNAVLDNDVLKMLRFIQWVSRWQFNPRVYFQSRYYASARRKRMPLDRAL